MRIVILSFFQNSVTRGVETYVAGFKKHLSNYFQIEVVSDPNVSPYTGHENSLLRRLYLDHTSRGIYRASRRRLAELASRPPDILYPVNNGWQSLLCKFFCSRYKTKLVLAGHSGPGWDDRINLMLKPDVFIAFSKAQRRWAGNSITIPHGVDLKQFSPLQKKANLNLPKPVFVTTSALSPQGRAGETHKNIDLTIKALAALEKGSLLLIGKGRDKDRIDKLAKSLLGPKRYLRISVSHNIINRYYTAGDIFTLVSSASEAFGLAYLEALASNLPVVTINDPLRREIIGPAGIFIKDPYNITRYSRGLRKAAKTNWGNKPRNQAEKYSWDKIAPQYQQLFKSLI